MTIKAAWTRFGTTAVRMGYITRDQLVEAMIQQIDSDLADKPHQPLGAILIDRGWITLQQLEGVVDEIVVYLSGERGASTLSGQSDPLIFEDTRR